MRRRWIVCASFVVLAACSGGDESASTTAPAPTTVASAPAATAPVTDPPTTDAPATTEAATTTASAATTEPPVETTPPETTPTDTTEPAPTTTVGDGDPAAIEAEWREAIRLFRVAQMDPTDLAAVEAAVRYRTGDNRLDLGFFLAQMRDRGRRILPDPVVPATLTLEVAPVPIGDDSGDFLMTVCEVDSWVLVQDGADGETTVISDEVVSSRDELRMNFFEGRWTILARERLETADGADLCGG